MTGVYVLCIVAILNGVTGRHGDDCPHVGDCPLVDNAIENVEVTYSDRLCKAIDDIQCSDHHALHDEQICGTNGHTYNNHCLFAKARCTHNHLDVAYHGPCVITTPPPPTTTTTEAKTTAYVVDVTDVEITTITNEPTTTITEMPTPATTTLSSHNILNNVFCQQAAHIDCNYDFDIVCGTDGTFYPNECELLKARCNEPTLATTDLGSCHLPSS